MTHVYVIQAEGGPVKVGRSASVQERLLFLRCASPLPLELAYAQDFENPHRAAAVERTAHKLLREAQSHGEWFKVSAEQAIAAVQAAAADPYSQDTAGRQTAARGAVVRKAREDAGWTVEDAARAAGMTIDAVISAENGWGYDSFRKSILASLPTNGGEPGVKLRKEPPTT